MANVTINDIAARTTLALTDEFEGQQTAGGESFKATLANMVLATLLDEDDMASNSADLPATQQSIKAYVDTTSVMKSVVDAKGDIVVATAADTVARLPAGTDGYVLTADAAEVSGLKWAAALESIIVACSDETTELTAGAIKTTFRMPYAFYLTEVRASVTTAPTGSTIIVDINESGATVLSTELTIDAGEKTSTTATTQAVISDSALADDAEITIDIDQVGSTVAGAGLKVYLIGYRK